MSPIDCEKVLEEIELYLDGEIPDDGLRIEIAAHLSSCGPCMGRADFRRRLKDLITGKCRPEQAPPDLLERIRGAIHDA